jgi:NADH-quinone oxidoreductase subunit K
VSSIPLDQVLVVAAVLFLLGLVGVLVRRNLIVVLSSIEIMLNSAGMAFVAAGSRWGHADGQVLFILILVMAASEVSVGLALLMLYRRRFRSIDVDEARRLRG